MSSANVNVIRSGGLAILELNHPPVNALDLELIASVEESLDAITDDSGLRALMIRGSGGHFAAGADITAAKDMSTDDFRSYISAIHRVFNRIEVLQLPTVAAIEGFAVGGGLELAMCCDVRVISESARVGLPELRLGLMPGAGGLQRLLPLLGKGRLLEMAYSARLMDAAEALRSGIVEVKFPDKDFLEHTEIFAQNLANGPLQAQKAVKACVLTGRDEGITAGLQAEIDQVITVFATPDAKEGMAAFLEKRAPKFGQSSAASRSSQVEKEPQP